MRISEFRVFRFRLPLKQPLALKDQTIATREGLLVRLTAAERKIGWGEIAPLPGFSEETLEQAISEVQSLRSLCLDNWFDPGELLPRRIARRTLLPSVQCGLEMAMLNLGASCKGITMARLLDPQCRSQVAVNALIASDESDPTAAAVEKVARGYRSLKLKVGRQLITEEINLICRVRTAVGPEIELRLDANRAWSLDDARQFAEGIRACGIAYIEEPLADPSDLPILCHETGLPIALDETMSVLNPGGVPLFPGFKAMILKPTLLGGLDRCRRFAREAFDDGLVPVISSSFESGVGIAALANLAAACMPEGVACGLDTLSTLERDNLTRSQEIHDGRFDLDELKHGAESVDIGSLEEIPGA